MNLLWYALGVSIVDDVPPLTEPTSETGESLMALFLVRKQVFARERLTATSSAVKTLTASKYENSVSPVGGNQHGTFKRRASGALVQLVGSSGDLVFTTDGTDPTADTTVSGVGSPAVTALSTILLETHEDIVNFKAIAVSTDAIFEVWYCR